MQSEKNYFNSKNFDLTQILNGLNVMLENYS